MVVWSPEFLYKIKINVWSPELDPNPEALMAAAAALAAGKLPRAAGTRGVRKTPVKWLSARRQESGDC